MSSHIFADHPLPWSTDGVFIRDGRARIIGAMHTLYQAQHVVEAVNGPAQLPLPEAPPPAPAPPTIAQVLAVLPPPSLHDAREVLKAQGLRDVPEVATFVLEAMADAPERALERERSRDDWRGRVAAAELTRRLDEFARTRHQG